MTKKTKKENAERQKRKKKKEMSEEPDFELPQASIVRLVKMGLPAGVALGKDAKLAFSKSTGIFILYLTFISTEFCRENKRQTISARDVLAAIEEIEFDDWAEPLAACLKAFRAKEAVKKIAKKPSEPRSSSSSSSSSAPPPPPAAAAAVPATTLKTSS